MQSTAEHFLDLACLRYDGGDESSRREEALRIATETPGLAGQSLHAAAALGAVGALREHLEREPAAAIQPGGSLGWTPLLYACYSRVGVPGSDWLGVVKALLAAGADPNAHFELWGGCFTALTGALGEGERGIEAQPPHPEARALAELLLEAGADPNDGQGLYNTMFRPSNDWLHLFIANGLNADHEINWEMGVDPTPSTFGFLLSHAADKGFLARIELLLSHGADALGRNPYNGRHIHTNAILCGNSAVVQRLKREGTPTSLSADERFRLACFDGALETARDLWDAYVALRSDASQLRDAATAGALVAIEVLVTLGADVNAGDAHGVTALHVAAEAGQAGAVRELLDCGADATLVETKYGATALGWAQHAGRDEAAEVLREHAAGGSE